VESGGSGQLLIERRHSYDHELSITDHPIQKNTFTPAIAYNKNPHSFSRCFYIQMCAHKCIFLTDFKSYQVFTVTFTSPAGDAAEQM